MKAVIINEFGGPEQLIYTDVAKPVPRDDEILVRNEIIGVGKPDYLMRSGNDPYLEDKLPGLIVGNESAGIVEAVGKNVKNIKLGDAVAVLNGTGCGSHAEYSCAEERFAIVLPKGLSPRQVPGVLNLQVAYALLYEVGRGTDGHSLYIAGAAGGIGTTLIQMAKDKGMDVIASASSEKKCAALRQVGADCVFNYKTADVKGVVLNHTNGRGVDLIYDQVCGPNFKKQFDYLADFGQIVLYNWLKGSPELDQLDTIIKRAWHGNAIRCFSFHAFDDKPERRLANAQKCFEMIRDGRGKPPVYKDLPLSEARQAHELLDAGKIIGKLIMHP
mgnify:FL=1